MRWGFGYQFFTRKIPGHMFRVRERGGWYTKRGISVVYLGFGLNENSGLPTVARLRRIGLDDEVKALTRKINKKFVRHENVVSSRVSPSKDK
jgi:hypothetical protein